MQNQATKTPLCSRFIWTARRKNLNPIRHRVPKGQLHLRKKFLHKFDVFTQVNTVPLNILLSQKLYAEFNRPGIMGRDIYDILFLWPKTQPDYDYLNQKLKINTSKELKEYLIKKSSEVNFELFAKDLEPFVFQPKDAKKTIQFPEWVKTKPPL